MMPGKIKIRIIQPYHGYEVGAIIYPPGMLRSWLLDKKIGEIVKDGEADAPPVPQESAPVKRKPGRPPKAR